MANKPYKIVRNDVLGRYMVANRNLKQGELILKEPPTLLGPLLNGPARCFKCFKTINLLMCAFCDHCNTALMCTNDCKGPYHSEDECLTLRTQKMKGQILAENPAVIMPLRCLLLNIYDPECFKRILELEAHLNDRRGTAIWRRHRISVEDVLKDTNLLSESDIKEELVQKICGILDVNTFEVRAPDHPNISIDNPQRQCLRGLYAGAAMMAHDCLANTHLSIDDDFMMYIYAQVDIKENEPILCNYANVLNGNQERRQHLFEGKCFYCSCNRCQDPTELGTEISTLVCHKCRKGLLRFEELEKNFKMWRCSECKHCFKDFLIGLAAEEARNKINDLLGVQNIQELEKMYQKLLLTFHPNHFVMLELKGKMSKLYAELPTTKHNLIRKLELTTDIISMYSTLEPGISRGKALAMYEQQSAMVFLCSKRYKEKEISKEELLIELYKAEEVLKQSIKYLLYEPPKSPEGRIAGMALNELKMLRSLIKSQQGAAIELMEQPVDEKKLEITKRLREKLEKNKENIKKEEEGTNEKTEIRQQTGKKKNKKKNKNK